MFGVPSGVIWDPAGTRDELLPGGSWRRWSWRRGRRWRWRRSRRGRGGHRDRAGEDRAGARAWPRRSASPGSACSGDRYFVGDGTFASGRPGSALTLVEAEVLESLAAGRGAPVDHRRNLVVRGTDLNALVGVDFTVGAVRCRGRRLCEPCAHLDRLNGGALLRPMVHRGGLRADILEPGEIHVGDPLMPCPA